MTALVWALLAAALYGTGAALQQHQAAQAPQQATARPRLLLLLARRPGWLLGIAAELGGFVAHAVALRSGPLIVVQILLACSLIFSVATVRLRSGRRLSCTAWAAALSVVTGIGSFVALTSPAEPAGGAALSRHAGLAATCLGAVALPAAAAGLAAGVRRRAVLLAVAAGVGDAGTAVITMAFSHAISHGPAAVLTSWATYALAVGGPCSLLLTQTAYQTARPMTTLPVVTVVSPLASLAAGIGFLGESTRLSTATAMLAALAVLVTLSGLVILARKASAPAPARDRRADRGPRPAPVTRRELTRQFRAAAVPLSGLAGWPLLITDPGCPLPDACLAGAAGPGPAAAAAWPGR